jgi:hypothetical protein
MSIVDEVKKKKELSGLPNSIIERALGATNGDVKEARALLRKYFGVFLTNRILKGAGGEDFLLSLHMSSKKRNYVDFYKNIFEGIKDVGTIIDLGAGINGFSYKYLNDLLGPVNYVAVEAAEQEVKHMNDYFKKNNYSAVAIAADLFDLDFVLGVLSKQKKERVVFLFQVIDALENMEKNFSKIFLSKISEECEKIVLTLPTESLGGRKKFSVQRKWLLDFLKEKFIIERDFVSCGERVLFLQIIK